MQLWNSPGHTLQLQILHKLFSKKAGMISSQSDNLLAYCCSRLAQTTTSSILLTVILSQSTILGQKHLMIFLTSVMNG